jgi:hypothetical protein
VVVYVASRMLDCTLFKQVAGVGPGQIGLPTCTIAALNPSSQLMSASTGIGSMAEFPFRAAADAVSLTGVLLCGSCPGALLEQLVAIQSVLLCPGLIFDATLQHTTWMSCCWWSCVSCQVVAAHT